MMGRMRGGMMRIGRRLKRSKKVCEISYHWLGFWSYGKVEIVSYVGFRSDGVC